MTRIQPRQSDATRTATPIKSGYSLRMRLLSASLCLGAGGGTSVSAVLASTPQAAFSSLPLAHGTSANVWHNSANGSLAGLSAHAASAQSQNLAHSAFNQTSANAATMHWLPSALGQNTIAKPNLSPSLALSSILRSTPGASDINLYSPVAQFAAGSLAGFHAITIDVGGKQQTLDFGSKLTGAELLAAQQVLDGGKQTLVVNASGIATGGTFNLNSAALTAIDPAVGGSIGSLDISHGVVLVDTLSSLNLVGALVNYGTISVGAPLGAKNQLIDTITAANIYNASSGVIASAAGSSGVKGTDLSLLSSGALVNEGTITANHNLNLSAGSITNSGLLNATSGSVNIAGNGTSAGAADITFNGAGGTVQALKGEINFNAANFAGVSNISVTGGNFLSQNLNFNAGSGAVNADMDQVSGVINGSAAASHITASTANLQLGNIVNAGDPTYYNAAGDITIDGTVTNTGGADLAIVASGNIIANGGTISTSVSGGNSGNVTLIAGADFTTPTSGSSSGPNPSSTITLGNSATVGGGSATGGYIDLSGITYTGSTKNLPVTQITTASDTGNSGNVLMVAYAGSGANSGNVQATATASQVKGASTINTVHTDASKSGGDVTVIAGGTAINAQNISVNATGVNASTITLLGATPMIAGGTLSITDGTVTGNYSASPTVITANVTVGALSGGTVTIRTGGTINEAKGGNITAANIALTASSVGTSKAALLTSALSTLTINGSSTTASYVTDATGTAVISGVSTAPGQSIAITEAAANMSVGNLNYTSVTLTDASKTVGGGNIVLNAAGTSGAQVGEVYSTSKTATNALGTGTVTITASGNISEGVGTTTPVIVAKNVILTSTGGSIGTIAPSNVPVVISGAFLTANAAKGSVNINDLVQTTLNAGTAATAFGAPGGGAYDVTGNGLAIAGVINGYNIALVSGPGLTSTANGSAVAINANVGSSKSNNVEISATGGIIEQNLKATVAGINVILAAPTGSSIGATNAYIQTKAVGTLNVQAAGAGISNQTSAYINQTGNVTLVGSGNSATSNGLLVVKDTSTLSLGVANGAAATLDYGQIILQAPVQTIVNTAITTPSLHFQSPAALLITGVAPSVFNVGNLYFEGTTNAGATSITLGNAKDGTANPFISVLNGTVAAVQNLLINTKGNFVSSLPQITTGPGSNGYSESINVNAATIVQTGIASQPFIIETTTSSATNSGDITLNLTGTKAINLTDSGSGIQVISNTGSAGGSTVSVAVKGALTIDGNGLQVLSGSSGTNLSISASSLTVAVSAATAISAGNVTIVAPVVVVNTGGTITAANSTTITAKGALSVSGAGTIDAGQNLNLGSASVSVIGAPVAYVTTGITLGAAKGGAGDPLATSIEGGHLQNLSIATTGNLTANLVVISLDRSDPGSITINAAGIVNTNTAPVGPVAVIAAGVGAAPGNVSITLTGTQPLNLGTEVGSYEIIITTDQSSGGGNVAVSSKGSIFASQLAVTANANSTISLVSSGGSFVESGVTTGSFISVGTNTNLTLGGAKGLSLQDANQLVTNNITNLTLTSGATTPLVIGAKPSTTAGQANWINGSIGVYTFGNSITSTNSDLGSLTINTGAGISLVPNITSGTISVAPTGTLILNSTGTNTILGAASSIQPGTALGIYGAKGIVIGTRDAEDSGDPFTFLTQTTDPVNALQIITPGTFSTAITQVYVDVSGGASTNAIGAQNHNLAVAQAITPPATPPLTQAQVIIETQKLDNKLVSFGLAGLFLVNMGPVSSGPNFKTNAVTPEISANTGPIITVNITGAQNVILGEAGSATTEVISLNINGSAGGTINFSTQGTVTVGISGNPGGPAVSLAGPGSITIASGGNQIVNAGGIILPTSASTVDLTLSSAKSLAVLDSTLLNAASLNSVTLASAGTGSFVVNASGTFTNGTAGNIAAPTVTILAPSLTNSGKIDGVGSGATLNLGAPGSGSFAVVPTVAGTYGQTQQFESVSIIASGAINLGNLFTSTITLGSNAVANVSITGPIVNGLATPSGVLTFSPNGTGISVGADAVTGAGGSITINAKSLAFSPISGGPAFLSFDASTIGSSNLAGAIVVDTTSALTVGTAKGDIAVNVGGSGNGGLLSLSSSAGTLTLGGPAIGAHDITLRGNNIVVATNVSGDDLIDIQTNGKAGVGTITESGTSLLTTGTLLIAMGSTKLAAMPLQLNVNTLFLSGGALNLTDTYSGSITALALTPLVALTLTNTGSQSGGQFNVGNISATNGSINIIDSSTADTINVSGYLLATNGNILVQNTGTTAAAAINVSNADIYASSTAVGLGQVSLVIGAIPTAASLIAGLTPANVGGVQTVGGNVYLGNVGNTGGTFSASDSTTLNALGRNIIINEGTSGGAINFSGSNSVTADPPVGAVQVSASNASLSMNDALAPSTIGRVNTLTVNLPQSSAVDSSIASGNLTAGIVDARVESCNDQAACLSSSLTSAVKIESIKGSENSIRKLECGVSLISPESDTVVQTGFGSVSVAAHAVVIIMSFDGGMAVYNLHDDKRSAVSINVAGEEIAVGPGRSAVLTNRNIRCFEEINPAQTVDYRSMTAIELPGGVKAFQSEFGIVSLLRSVGPLKQFVSASAPANQRVKKSMLKTAAILMQYGGAKPYQQMIAPQLTAQASR